MCYTNSMEISVDQLFDEDFTPAWARDIDDRDRTWDDQDAEVEFNYKKAAEQSRLEIARKYARATD